MRIRIVNPNTTTAFTEGCLAVGRGVAAQGTEISATNPATGVPSVECHLDEAVATLGIIEAMTAGEAEGVDAYVIACFGDTGLDAAREVARGPVIGMSEAAVYAAAMIAPVFSIITLPSRTRVFSERVLQHAGLAHRCGPVRAINVGVGDCEEHSDLVFQAFVEEARRAIADDHAEAIILGCAGLEGLAEPLRAALGVPIVEGVAAGVKMAEGLISLGLSTSKAGGWGFPPAYSRAAAKAGRLT
jgi:allantoin racemase